MVSVSAKKILKKISCLCTFKERSVEVFRKICPSPVLWDHFKDFALPSTAVGNSETNSQRGSDIHRAVALVAAFQMLNGVPYSLWRAASVFALVLTSLEASPRSCQHRVAFIALLPISWSVHSSFAYMEKQHSNYEKLFFAIGYRFPICS
jgi:hypothetical protein